MRKATLRNGKDKWTSPERRDSPRFPVNVPASITIASTKGELHGGAGAARIVDVSSTAAGLRVSFETDAEPDEISAVLSRACMITIDCTFPGSDDPSRLSGDVVWYRAIPSASGMSVRLGVSLKGTNSRELESVWSFLAHLERGTDSG